MGIDTGLSQILLGVVSADKKDRGLTRHEKRFGITSFIYRARRPFHPERFHDNFLANFFAGALQQAGNIMRIKPYRPWLCELRHLWQGSPSEPEILKALSQDNGEAWPWGDRRQELVFIGKALNHESIQKTLDDCLLNDQEL